MTRTSSATNQVFVIKRGESLSTIADRLVEENLIRNALVFRIYTQVQGLTKKIQAGKYLLSPSSNISQLTAILIKGPADLKFTFPEGWRKEEYAKRLAANLNDFDYQNFLKQVIGLEGKLFPDTYLIPIDTGMAALIDIFTKNFAQKTSSLDFKNEDLILASIIEREAKTDADRQIVAGILTKRLEKGWPLQADATIQYALGKEGNWWPSLSKKDLELNSLYNTYKYKGLPPTPICNPGLASIKAALNPIKTSYWFYLSDNQGQIHYAQTLEEHNQNIAKYLK